MKFIKIALPEDVTATTVLAADNISLDLCCHTLSAGNRANAIVGTVALARGASMFARWIGCPQLFSPPRHFLDSAQI